MQHKTSNKTSKRLEKNIEKILTIWEKRVNKEIKGAHLQETIALRDSLPEYIGQLVRALSTTADQTSARKKSDKVDSTRVGKKHGEDRASVKNYTMDQLIFEYHILRQVLCDVMEEEVMLTPVEREVIVCSIEQAVNDAATEFTSTLKGLQERVSHTLAHDLRNPITSAKISAQLLLRKLEDDDPSAPKLSLIISNMDRLDHMITDLLDASRLHAGQTIEMEFKPCDLNKILKDVVTELSIAYPRCFELQSNEQCQGNWNENGLRRLIENLVTNAVKYGEADTTIKIELSQEETLATLSVHNFGKPIPSEEQSILFEQYRRASSSESIVGWGLGLSMVKGMVDAHHGTIKVESEKSIGTTFTVTLPKRLQKTEESDKPKEPKEIEHR